MLKRVTIRYSVVFEAEVVLQQHDGVSNKELIEIAGQEVDIPSGGNHNSQYVDDSFSLIDGNISNV